MAEEEIVSTEDNATKIDTVEKKGFFRKCLEKLESMQFGERGSQNLCRFYNKVLVKTAKCCGFYLH